MIGLRPFAAGPQEHPVDGHLLDVGKLREQCGIHVAEKIGDGGIRQHRLGLANPRRYDGETPLASLRHRRQPERGLPDAGFTLDDQSRGARGCRLQELGHGPELLRTAHHAGTHDSPIVSANPEFTDQVPGEQYLACLTGQVDESFSDHKTERLQSYWQLQRAVGSGVVASALHGSTTGLCLIRVPTSPESRWCGRPAWSQVLETRSNESALNTP